MATPSYGANTPGRPRRTSVSSGIPGDPESHVCVTAGFRWPRHIPRRPPAPRLRRAPPCTPPCTPASDRLAARQSAGPPAPGPTRTPARYARPRSPHGEREGDDEARAAAAVREALDQLRRYWADERLARQYPSVRFTGLALGFRGWELARHGAVPSVQPRSSSPGGGSDVTARIGAALAGGPSSPAPGPERAGRSS